MLADTVNAGQVEFVDYLNKTLVRALPRLHDALARQNNAHAMRIVEGGGCMRPTLCPFPGGEDTR